MSDKEPGYCQQRTSTEKLLGITVVVSVCVAIIMSSILVWQMMVSNKTTDMQINKKSSVIDDLCLTSECIHTASRVMEFMDRKVQPCDGFYSYACGGYLRTTSIPDDDEAASLFSLIQRKVTEQLRTAIEEPITDQDIRPVRIAKKLYQACINTTLLEERGLKPMKDIFKDFGGWPVLEDRDWDQSGFDWKYTVHKMGRVGLGANYIIALLVGIDAKNSTKRMITFDQPNLGLNWEYLIKGSNDKRVEAYHKYQVEVAVNLGADLERAKEEMKEALQFETALANISISKEERRNESQLHNPMSIDEMQKKYPSIPWLQYINNILPKKVQVDENEVVNVRVPTFVTKLEKLLAGTDKRIQANYIFWRVAAAMVYSSTEAMMRSAFKYSKASSGILVERPRWKFCIDSFTRELDMIMGSMYVKQFLDKKAKNVALEVVSDIQQTFSEMLGNVDWMDERTRKKALTKVKSMAAYIAYPDELLDDNKLDQHYKKLKVNENMYLESMMNVTKFLGEFDFARLRKRVNKTDWKARSKTTDANVIHSPVENSIKLPAAVLQGLLFGTERPKYMNYGAIGFAIGHEMTHGFDQEGRQYNGNGNLVEWWDATTKENYLSKVKCFIEQYGKFTESLTGLKLNGVITQRENIADYGGIKVSYMAYVRWSKRHGVQEPRLAGLESLSPRQMFWVAGAQILCSKYSKEYMNKVLTTDPQTPSMFRVDGTFSNIQEFSEDFYCPLGSKMNPALKCQVW